MAYGPNFHFSRNCQKYDKSRTSQKQPIEKNNFGFHLPYTTYHQRAWDRMPAYTYFSNTPLDHMLLGSTVFANPK